MTQEGELRAMLLELQERASARLGKLRADLDALTATRRNESDDDEHDPEGETLSARWSMLSGLVDSTRENAAQIDAALGRLDEGSYGVCASCGRPIPFEQLEARPFREQCVPCASSSQRP